MYDNELKTKEKKIKPRIKLNHNITTLVVFSQGMMPKHDNLNANRSRRFNIRFIITQFTCKY